MYHGSYQRRTQVSEILEADVVYEVNLRALCRLRPDAVTFGNVRTHLVRSAMARHHRSLRDMDRSRRNADRLEKELVL
jgi:hypothetical protein